MIYLRALRVRLCVYFYERESICKRYVESLVCTDMGERIDDDVGNFTILRFDSPHNKL